MCSNILHSVYNSGFTCLHGYDSYCFNKRKSADPSKAKPKSKIFHVSGDLTNEIRVLTQKPFLGVVDVSSN